METKILSDYNKERRHPPDSPLCFAPWTSISFNVDGTANVCCLNRMTTVSVKGQTIREIWDSELFNRLRRNVAGGNLQYDCDICGNQIKAGNFSGVKSRNYDDFHPPWADKPVIMEFCLDNTCNLACTMCNSLLSSSIRKTKNIPPLKKYYDEHFVAQIDPYLPYLKEAVFSGGEPFLVNIYYSIWEKMVAVNPDILISIVTNGTILNDRIKTMLERGRFRINISIDSADKTTYESIRKNADFETVMDHFRWFKEYSMRKKLPLNIPVCPLTTNWHTIPDTIRFANLNDTEINFVYVERPRSLSLVYREPEYLDKIIQHFKREIFEKPSSTAEINIKRFHALISDLEYWKNKYNPEADNYSEEQLQKLVENKIRNIPVAIATGNPEMSGDQLAGKWKEVLDCLPAEKRLMALQLLYQFKLERMVQILTGQSPREIAVIIEENF